MFCVSFGVYDNAYVITIKDCETGKPERPC